MSGKGDTTPPRPLCYTCSECGHKGRIEAGKRWTKCAGCGNLLIMVKMVKIVKGCEDNAKEKTKPH